MDYHEITVPRTARFALSAEPGDATTEIWFACHGYAQLAGSFLESLMPAAAPGRVLVAPEGLSRFYLDSGAGRVGASWMTKEGREAEIRDYVALLDAVRAEVTRGLPSHPSITILGFSQGSATAFRWAVRGKTPPDRLILWGGGVPGDHDPVATRQTLGNTSVTLVTGTRDRYTSPSAMERDAATLRETGVAVDVAIFDGGHRLDDATLLELADRTD